MGISPSHMKCGNLENRKRKEEWGSRTQPQSAGKEEKGKCVLKAWEKERGGKICNEDGVLLLDILGKQNSHRCVPCMGSHSFFKFKHRTVVTTLHVTRATAKFKQRHRPDPPMPCWSVTIYQQQTTLKRRLNSLSIFVFVFLFHSLLFTVILPILVA